MTYFLIVFAVGFFLIQISIIGWRIVYHLSAINMHLLMLDGMYAAQHNLHLDQVFEDENKEEKKE